jgi:hypothetical protein
MNQQPHPKANAIAKAREAAEKMTAAARLLREAADGSTWAEGKGDFLHYAARLEELISCDDGEGGLFAAIDTIERIVGKQGRVHTIAKHTTGSTYKNR